MKRRTVKRLFSFPRRSPADVRGDVGEEFQFHLDARTADLVRGGLTDAEARAQALREFGDVRPAPPGAPPRTIASSAGGGSRRSPTN